VAKVACVTEGMENDKSCPGNLAVTDAREPTN